MGDLADLYAKRADGGSGGKKPSSLRELYAARSGKADDGGGKGGGILDKLKGAGGNVVGTALEGLDLGRAAVTATALELGDGARALAGKDAMGDRGRIRDRGFSLSDIVDNTKAHIGVGDIIEDNTVTDDLPINVKRALGFAGDVALDPLTYATFGASAGATGARKGGTLLTKEQVLADIAHLGDDAVERLGGRAAVDNLANEVAGKGAGQLSKEAASELGAKTGLQFDLGPLGTHTVPGTSKAAAATGRAGSKVKRGIIERFDADFVEKFQSIPTEGLRRGAVQRGELADLKVARYRASKKALDNVAGSALSQLANDYDAAYKQFGDTDPDVLRNAIETKDFSVPGAKAIADINAKARSAYLEITGRELGDIDGYLSHMLTPEGRKVIEESTARFRSGGKEAFQHHRTIDGTIDEINQAALEKFGQDAIQLFETNPWGITDAYLRSVHRAILRDGMPQSLLEAGLTETVDKAAVGGAIKTNERVGRKVDDLTQRAGQKQAAAESLADVGDDLRAAGDVEGPIDFTGDPTVERLAAQQGRQAERAGGLASEAEARLDEVTAQIRERSSASFSGRTQGDLDRLDGVAVKSVDAGKAVNEAQAALDEATATLKQARDDVVRERKAVYGKNRTASERVARGRAGLDEAKTSVRAAKAEEAGAKKTLADARREATVAQKAVDGAPAVTAAVEHPEVAGMRAELDGLAPQVDAAERELADAEKGLEFGAADGEKINQAGRSGVEAAIARAVEAQRALDGLADRKGFLEEEIAYLAGKTSVAADTTHLADAVRSAGIKVTDAEGVKAAKTAARQEAEGALEQIDQAVGVDVAEMDPAVIKARAAAEKELEKRSAHLAKAEKVLADSASAFDVARASMLDDVSERAVANEGALQALRTEADELGSKVAHYRRVELGARETAADLFAAASQEPDPILKQIAQVEAMSAVEAGKAARLLDKADVWSAKRIPVDDASLARYQRVLDENMVAFAGHKNMYAHPEVADAVQLLRDNLTPQKVGSIIKAHDQILSRWKAWSLMSPGYHGRNFMSAMFMNGVAGMEGSGGRAYFRFGRAVKAFNRDGLEGVARLGFGKEYDAAFGELTTNWRKQMFDDVGSGIDAADALRSGAQTQDGVLGKALTTAKGRNYDLTALNARPLELNFKMAGKVEKMARGPLFIDGLMKGMKADEAFERVVKFHFDYGDLSQVEQRYARRVIPFYTWMRKNFPVQIEMMAKKPGHYTRYLHAKRNIELGTEGESVVPAYFKSLLAIRTPFKQPGTKNMEGDEASMYLMPDLPFVRLAETFDSNILLSQMSPIIKTPLEVQSGKQFFSGIPFKDGYQKAPESPGWGPILRALELADGKLGLPNVERHSNGDLMIQDADAYKIEQFLPLLGRMRRNAPSEERYQDRVLTTWLSTFLGTGARTNTKDQQDGELRRISYAAAADEKKAKALGK